MSFSRLTRKRFVESDSIGGGDVLIVAERGCADGIRVADEVQFPLSLPDRLQVDTEVVEEGSVRVGLVKVTVEQVANVVSVDDAVVRNFGAGQGGERRQDVECAGDGIAGGSLWYAARPPENRRDPHAAFEG